MTDFAKTLNRRVNIMKPGGADELGQPDPSRFSLVGRLWANIGNLRGTEAIRAGALTGAVHCSIRLRYREDLAPGMRVERGQQRYVVRAVLPDEVQRRHVDLVCEVQP